MVRIIENPPIQSHIQEEGWHSSLKFRLRNLHCLLAAPQDVVHNGLDILLMVFGVPNHQFGNIFFQINGQQEMNARAIELTPYTFRKIVFSFHTFRFSRIRISARASFPLSCRQG